MPYVSIPRYAPVDALVCEATLAGCAAALRLAEAGCNTALVCSAMSLCHEAVPMLRPWLSDTELARLPAPLRAAVESATAGRGQRGLELHPGHLARAIEDVLLSAGVRLWYGARPAALVLDEGRIGAVCVGGSFGVVALPTAFVVDATLHATLARLAKVPRASSNHPRLRLAGVLTAVGGDDGDCALEGVDGTLSRRGRFACWEAELDPLTDEHLGWSRAVRAAQAAVAATCDLLRAAGSAMAFTPQRGCDAPLPRPMAPLAIDGVLARPDLAVLSAHAPAAGDWRDATAVIAGDALNRIAAAALAARSTWCLPADGAHLQHLGGAADTLAVTPRLADPHFDEPGAQPSRLAFAPPAPLYTAEVLVVGAGTSGFPAAVTAAEQGLKTMCVDGFAEAGGANTVGGVAKLWYGRWTPALNRWYRLATEPTRLGGKSPAQAMMAHAAAVGVDHLPLLPACGAAVRDGRVERVYVLGPAGLCALAGTQVIDGTGDGAIAAWAGADYTWGAERDEITLWSSFGSFRHGTSEASRQFLSCADQRSLADLSRAAIGLRRLPGFFGEQEFPVFYLVARESRHVAGRSRLDYAAMARGAWFHDTLVAARSNIDIKGVPSSDLALAGFIERDYYEVRTCRIPWGAVLPRGLRNLAVVGKAYDASHDALAMARMQPDLASLGLAVGHAVALARGADLDAVDIAAVQARLVTSGVLLPVDLLRSEVDTEVPAGDDLAMLAERIATCPTMLIEQVRMAGGGAAAREALERRFGADDYYGRFVMARLLALLGSPIGCDALLADLDTILADPTRMPGHAPFHTFAMPDHGWAPPGAHAIAALGLAGDHRVIPRLERAAGMLAPERERCDWTFCWIFAIAHAAERLADPDLSPVLLRLLDLPALRDRRLLRAAQPAAIDVVAERHGYLALCLARALARCGDRRGHALLISWLDDQRLFLARSARRELVELLGCDDGFDAAAWTTGLTAAEVRPCPWIRRLD